VVPQVSDEVVTTPGSTNNQTDQGVPAADHGKTQQIFRESAPSRNQDSEPQEHPAQGDASEKDDAS